MSPCPIAASLISERGSPCHLSRLEWNPDPKDDVPLVVIDGQPMTWDDFGRLLMSFEGWQFELEIRDLSEDV